MVLEYSGRHLALIELAQKAVLEGLKRPDDVRRGIDWLVGLESALHRALELDHFILDFQPQIDSYSGGVVGVEALLRWKDPDRGIVPPNQFIPIR